MNLSEDISDKGKLVSKLRAALGKSTLTLSGEQHRARRAVLHERLSRGVANGYVSEMVATIRSTCLSVMNDAPFRADLVGGSLALRLICVALFGYRVLNHADELVIMQAVNSLEESLQAEMFRFLPRSPWQKRKDERTRSEALKSIAFIISKVRASANESSVLKALEGLGLDEEEIRDEIATMIIAGYHTTGAAISWLLYYLSHEKGAVEAIRAEYGRISDGTEEPDPRKLATATASLNFVKEVLRLYPSAWWTTREFKTTAEIGGITVKRGTTLIVSPWVYHRDPANFDNPNGFRMDRSYSSAAYLPFGVGARACVGMGVALLELQLVALEFAASLDLSTTFQESSADIAAGITLSAPQFEVVAGMRGAGTLRRVEAA
jgi:cytochrome P450